MTTDSKDLRQRRLQLNQSASEAVLELVQMFYKDTGVEVKELTVRMSRSEVMADGDVRLTPATTTTKTAILI